ncbi:MAG: hypothetical protein FJX57_09665, partial [Alphaproteobacteria bacterium]|nr:hypothetical protein [Alphaproteobacteria bacterium]
MMKPRRARRCMPPSLLGGDYEDRRSAVNARRSVPGMANARDRGYHPHGIGTSARKALGGRADSQGARRDRMPDARLNPPPLRSRTGLAGVYPILYALFDRAGRLDAGAMNAQVEACLRAGAHGIAVLGLVTEVNKLETAERRALVELVARDIAGRVPLAVTV